MAHLITVMASQHAPNNRNEENRYQERRAPNNRNAEKDNPLRLLGALEYKTYKSIQMHINQRFV